MQGWKTTLRGHASHQQELFIIESWALFYHQSTLNKKFQVTYYYGQLLDNSKNQNQINFILKMIKNTCNPPQGRIEKYNICLCTFKNFEYQPHQLGVQDRGLVNKTVWHSFHVVYITTIQ